jgi:hypothetical protein
MSGPVRDIVAPGVDFVLGIDGQDVMISRLNRNDRAQFGQRNTPRHNEVGFCYLSQAQGTSVRLAKRFQIQTINRQGQGKVFATCKLSDILSIKRLDLLKNGTKRANVRLAHIELWVGIPTVVVP